MNPFFRWIFLSRHYDIFFILTMILFYVQGVAYGALVGFSGSETQHRGKENVAFEAWDDAIGKPVRVVAFDDVLTVTSVPLKDYPEEGNVGTLLNQSFAVKDGGDTALFPSSDGDNRLKKESGTGFKGIGNPYDFTVPNENLLLLGANKSLWVNFGDNVDIDKGEIRKFGTTAAVGGFFSTTSQITLEIFDFDANSLGIINATPGSLDPFFLGFVFDDVSPIIATAQFIISGSGAFDGLAFASAVDAGMIPPTQPPLATVPIPAAVWFFGSGLAGLGILRRKGV